MNSYDWFMQSALSRGVEDPAAIGEKYLRTLDALSRIDPVLRGWIIWQSNCSLEDLEAWAEAGALEPAPVRPIPLEQARLDMTDLVEANVCRDDWDEPQPDEGYSLVANNGPDRTARSVGVSVTAGSEFNYNQWSVMFGDPARIPPDPSIMTYPILGGVFRVMTSIWPTPWAKLSGSTAEYEERPGVVGRTSIETFRHDITWMGYLSAGCAPGFQPPAELISERTADGGLLMISAEERPDPTNAEQMRRSDLLGAIMQKYHTDPFPHLKQPGG
jgi:hypothetical protein